jgi:uncharacterized protein YdeI (YjbR/CyaY-like superfamily)
MKEFRTVHVTARAEWRAWLKENHDKEKEIWLIYYKKHTGKPRVAYDDAVEEALCYGWIDSIVKRIDDETYAQKFTPRKAESKWSELNKRRVEKLIKAGKMTEFGLKPVEAAKQGGAWERVIQPHKADTLPPELKEELAAHPRAWENFQRLAPSYQRHFIGWITTAKKAETRHKRLREAIDLLTQNKKLGMK